MKLLLLLGAVGTAAAVGGKDMRPTWLRLGLERPAGTKEMGGWQAAVYTAEQQARLGVTELGELLAAAPKPIPKVTSSFCDDSVDFQLDKDGKPIGANFSYRVCMDVGRAASRLECTKDAPCPGGPDMALSVFANGTIYTVDHDGNCTSKPCPTCAPPDGMPFSFLLIDGADGNTQRGVATYNGTATIDGEQMDVFAHDRGQVAAGFGVMEWFISGNSLMRTTYHEPAGAGPNPGGSGSRDFSGKLKAGGKGTRVEPATPGSFAIPKGCTPSPAEAAPLPAQQGFGDGW